MKVPDNTVPKTSFLKKKKCASKAQILYFLLLLQSIGTRSGVRVRGLSLDPIDRSPFGHLMKFTQRSLPLYQLGLGTAFYRLGLCTAPTD